VQEQDQIDRAPRAEVEPDEGGDQHEQSDARLGELEEIGETLAGADAHQGARGLVQRAHAVLPAGRGAPGRGDASPAARVPWPAGAAAGRERAARTVSTRQVARIRAPTTTWAVAGSTASRVRTAAAPRPIWIATRTTASSAGRTRCGRA